MVRPRLPFAYKCLYARLERLFWEKIGQLCDTPARVIAVTLGG
jgi:hypothetical protein